MVQNINDIGSNTLFVSKDSRKENLFYYSLTLSNWIQNIRNQHKICCMLKWLARIKTEKCSSIWLFFLFEYTAIDWVEIFHDVFILWVWSMCRGVHVSSKKNHTKTWNYTLNLHTDECLHHSLQTTMLIVRTVHTN